MFDPNIMKNIKTDLVLNQMIGKIEIISADKMCIRDRISPLPMILEI